MKHGIIHAGIVGTMVLLTTSIANAAGSIPVLLEPDGVVSLQMHLVWQAEPGVRYNLQSASNLLSTWSPVPGYPAAAEGMSQEHGFTVEDLDRGFFRVSAMDEQPPRVVSQYPAVDGFAVGRFADLTVQLEDPSGLDPARLLLSAGSVLFEFDGSGTLIRAASIGGALTFPRIGMDLSGTEFKLREDGFEVTVKGVTYSVGSDLDWLEVTLPEYSWWLTPRIQAGLELDLGGMKSFEAIAQGDVSISKVVEGNVVLAGVSVEATLFDLQGPSTVIYLSQLGPIHVFATLGLKMGLKAEAEANTQVEFSATYRQDHSTAFGLSSSSGQPGWNGCTVSRAPRPTCGARPPSPKSCLSTSPSIPGWSSLSTPWPG